MEILNSLPGTPLPLGASVAEGGVNFSVFSRNATKVFLEFYSASEDSEPYAQVEFSPSENRTGDIWHAFVPGIKPGSLYLFRVDGPFEPSKGHRFNVHQRLFDPYAKTITPVSVFYNLPPDYSAPLDKNDIEHGKNQSAKVFPKCVVIDNENFDWQGDRPINRPLSESVIYEVHLKGFTAGKNAGVSCPGTYAGFIEKIPYLKDLGITAVELLPIFEFDEFENSNVNPRTGERMKNYWGYSTINFFSPKASFAADKTPGGCVNEFKTLVRELHKAGIEVILDVVFNHTAEGNEHGVALNFRGFENSVYYTLVGSHKEYYMNFSGCGNTMNCNHPIVRNFIIDSLRYWVLNYHVDGFRFDLASILCRGQEGYLLKFPPLTNAIAEDPVLGKTKIIAEPWDAGGAYQLGGFPGGRRWAEWNDRFRDDIRRFWRGDEYVSTNAATRISGSSDLFTISGRAPYHSINYVCCHDGFTMNDLVSYNGKHNDENGEGNRDGSDSNWSYNHGYEGPTLNPVIEKMRNRQMRNYILTLLISQGTPMLLGGDEFRRGQQGNNNAYCQDNDISWFDWGNCSLNSALVSFTRKAIRLRKDHPVFRRTKFFKGSMAGKKPDIQWYAADGSNPDWSKISRFLAFRLLGTFDSGAKKISDNDFFIAANTDRQDIMLRIPAITDSRKWYRIADTSIEDETSLLSVENAETLISQDRYVLPASSMLILVAK
ncbi:glycogen debranching protein GlgX [uncultured Treponema sp.]|uniref:glycogen debranching protein GlgX n=1 Tax=uncultured Treponema sp. TaxID=162155 RepID=UPI0025892830|nr:glycogen debranching protein GlgX [uncultured Treponema sp.]